MWQHWAFFLVLWIRVNVPGPFLPGLVCLLTLLCLGPPLEDLLALSHFLFPFSPCFVLLLVVNLVRNYPFPAFNLRKYQPCHLLACCAMILAQGMEWPIPVSVCTCCVGYLPSLLHFKALCLRWCSFTSVCVPLGPQELIGPVPLSSSPGQLLSPCSPHHSLPLRWGVLPQVHSTYFLTFIFCSGIREWDIDGICNDQENQHSTYWNKQSKNSFIKVKAS